MQLFGIPLSPFVRKVLIVAAEKGIEVEAAAGGPRDLTPEFLRASPFRKIPALIDGDFTLSDSTAIATYFEALVPQPALLPGDPRGRATAVWFEELADTIMVPAGQKVVVNRFIGPSLAGVPGDEVAAEQGVAALAPIIDYLESTAPAEGQWLAGESFSIADIAVASVLTTLRYGRFEVAAAVHPGVAAWYDRVCARPSWVAVAAREVAAAKALFESRIAATPRQ
jgi:glutathione S-transferase